MTARRAAKLIRTGKENRGERHQVPEVAVGKDVLELVSSAMYVDPMTVYREYVQNAADAVDTAKAKGQLPPDSPGLVEITVDPATRTVRIRDNGCGVAFKDFGRKLMALGGSAKRGTSARGFRGVGRLAGLGYAQELVFRSRTAGESKISVLRWDCRRMKAAFRDADNKIGVADLIRSVTTLERIEDSDAPERFFEAEMRGIVRLRNDRLMSPAAIVEYLSQVAPVPFAPNFRFGGEITEALSKHVDVSTLDIRVNGASAPVYRPHRDRFELQDKGGLSFDSVSVIEVPGIDGEVAAVGWVLHHEYEGAVPTSTLVKGLRLRAGNVQVGDHSLLEELFAEPRFNVWSVGEVHVIDRRIVPNGRRDHFEQNAHYHNLQNHLAPMARDIARRCRTSSIRRKWDREFELQARSAEDILAVIAQHSVSRAERDRLALSVEQMLLRMSKIAGMESQQDETDIRGARIESMRAKLGEVMNDASPVASPLMRLPAKQRAVYQKFFELVYECSANRVAAKSLIDRIMMRLEQ
ncbi:molecular chaperone Hsp90 [Methylosinus sporium]|uniref:Molecular chaperone Hsp90 n=1 Tax=Methylosinus sporium TaxID=428 RepID=A0A549T5Q9_METSR|nr:ATP-binding protein [Methylosinus sporium]TRL37182.1 molecular chaperone Hsp90 [Methylosinus sporium]